MLPIPLNTDAPIYHWPWMTVTLIAFNVLCFGATDGGVADMEGRLNGIGEVFLLEFGTHLNPLEWLTANFLHFGIFHLVFNMVFLWAFGLVVEGKLGWWRYLLVYLGIGMVGCGFVQLLMLPFELGPLDPRGAGGASLAIFGLLAICMVWAPKNEFSCLWWLLYRIVLVDISIQGFAMFYIGLQFLFALLGAFTMSSATLHLIGAFLGFCVAVVMLKMNWVDCENWDLFAVMKGTYGTRTDDELYAYRTTVRSDEPRKKRRRTEAPPEPDDDDDVIDPDKEAAVKAKVLRRLRQLLEDGKPSAAFNEYLRFKHVNSQWQLDQQDLQNLANGLYRAHRWSESVPLLEEYVERFPENAHQFRLKLAGVAIEVQRRPRYALRILDEIPRKGLGRNLNQHRKKMERIARRMIDEGVIELDGQAWS